MHFLVVYWKPNSVSPKRTDVRCTNSIHTRRHLISLLVSSMAEESGGPCRICLVTILSTVFILFRGQTNSFQVVINHLLIWKRTAFLFLWRSLSRVISLQPGSMPACESDTDLCNIEGNRRHQYISWGPLLSHQQCLRMAFHASELVTGNCV